MNAIAGFFVFVALGLMLGGAVTIGIFVLLSALALYLVQEGWDG